ncbi:MAG: type II toxin-antitoxin system Phd/YefM family antitoxin [Candidatus Peregrinibacteria bacterium]|nr:type II toxin-antitoxin system Phd/YefM family antitoxin [Candidatus Peregrinibacteria bacterium]MCB9807904.1 type II toxin-antitoxin system Phd/YefM family antitoxin [Candidatus Peribacteria bacterium]
MTIISITKARAQLYKLIDILQKGQPPVFITGKTGNAVLVSEDEWRSISETLHLLSIPGMKESLQEGMNEGIDDCVETIDL